MAAEPVTFPRDECCVHHFSKTYNMHVQCNVTATCSWSGSESYHTAHSARYMRHNAWRISEFMSCGLHQLAAISSVQLSAAHSVTPIILLVV